MLLTHVEMLARPGRRDELLAYCRAWMPRALAAGCLRVELLADPSDPDLCVLQERWPNEARFREFAAAEFNDDEQLARYRELAVDPLPLLRLFRVTGESHA